MDEFFRENFGKIAAWFPLVLVLLVAVTGVMAWRLWKAGRKTWWKIVGLVMAMSVFGFVVVALIIAYGPMSPLFTNAQRLQLLVGEPVPEIRFQLVQDGSASHLGRFRGKVVLLNLWATWCPPCLAELPTLNRLQKAYSDQGLVVVTLSDESLTAISTFVMQRAPDAVNGRVDSFDWLPIKDFRPFTLIIDRDGKLRDYMFADQTFETFEKKLRPYL